MKIKRDFLRTYWVLPPVVVIFFFTLLAFDGDNVGQNHPEMVIAGVIMLALTFRIIIASLKNDANSLFLVKLFGTIGVYVISQVLIYFYRFNAVIIIVPLWMISLRSSLLILIDALKELKRNFNWPSYPLAALGVVIVVCAIADIFLAHTPKLILSEMPLAAVVLLALLNTKRRPTATP